MSELPPIGGPVGRQELPPLGEPQTDRRAAFADWLDRIDDELIGAALLVAETLPRVAVSFLAGDRDVIPRTRSMATDVGERVRHVEEQGFLILAREAPVGGDLRRLVSMLRLITAVERAASLVRHVAELIDRVDARALPEDVRQQVDELARGSCVVYRGGVDAWRSRDGLAVSEIDHDDEAVDRLARGLVAQADQLDDPIQLMALGLLARYWERIADHGVAFAQHNTFAVTGERVEVGH